MIRHTVSNIAADNIVLLVKQWLMRKKIDVPGSEIPQSGEHASIVSGDQLSSRKSSDIEEGDVLNTVLHYDWKALEDKTKEIYQIVLNCIGGNKFRLSTYDRYFSTKEVETILNSLRLAGFNVRHGDFYDAIKIAKGVRDGVLNKENFKHYMRIHFRYASLNCFDYERFKNEMYALADKIGYQRIEWDAKTLLKVCLEATLGEGNNYKGRHLRYYGVNAYLSTRYRCLRLLDAILSTEHSSISLPEIRQLIIEKAKLLKIYSETPENGKISDSDLSDDNFKKLFYLLRQLINEDYALGKKSDYKRTVFESGSHVYKQFNENSRLSAFTVDISLWELTLIRYEIAVVCAKYFFDDRDAFAAEFPLLSMLGQLDEISFDDKDETILHKVKESNIHLVNYRVLRIQSLKKKCEYLISLGLPVIIKMAEEEKALYPISIKEDGETFALVAKGMDSDEIHVITPELLSHSSIHISDEYDTEYRERVKNRIVGTGPLLHNRPYDVELILPKEGYRAITRSDSAFRLLNPYIGSPGKQYYEGSKGSRISVSFAVYVNEDFLRELLWLDETGKLITVAPEEVKTIYETYFRRVMGKERVPYDDRPASNKRIRKGRGQSSPK